MATEKLFKIRVTGIVQGVFFRKTAQSKANESGLTGFVQNMDDGSVYIEARGQERALEQFVKWCWQGPARAEVENVEVTEAPLQEYDTFSIKR